MNQCACCFGLVNQEENLTCNGLCHQRFHPRCANWSPVEYKAYKSISSKIKWFCTACDEAIEEISSMYSDSSIKILKPKYENTNTGKTIPKVYRSSRSKSPVNMSYHVVPESSKETQENRHRRNQIESKKYQTQKNPKFLPPRNTADIQKETPERSPVSELSSKSDSTLKNSTESPKSQFSSIGTNTDLKNHPVTDIVIQQQDDESVFDLASLEKKTARGIQILSDDLEQPNIKSLMLRIAMEKLRLDTEERRLNILKESLTKETIPPGPSRTVRRSPRSPGRSPKSISPVNTARVTVSPITQSLQDGRRSLTHSPERAIVHKQTITSSKKTFWPKKSRKTLDN